MSENSIALHAIPLLEEVYINDNDLFILSRYETGYQYIQNKSPWKKISDDMVIYIKDSMLKDRDFLLKLTNILWPILLKNEDFIRGLYEILYGATGYLRMHSNYPEDQYRYITTQMFLLNKSFYLQTIKALKFSCFGYSFVKWIDKNNNEYQDGQKVIFSNTSVDISATWQKNRYTVKFLSQQSPETIWQLSTVAYKDEVKKPQSNPIAEGKRFNDWIPVEHSSYTIQSLSSVSCDMTFIADYIRICYLIFKYRNDEKQIALCTYTLDQGQDFLSDQYPPIGNFQKSLYTVSSFSPTEVRNIQEPTTVYVEDIPNVVKKTFQTPYQFTYNDQYHSTWISAISLDPPRDIPYIVEYKTEYGEWQKEPISAMETGDYEISARVSADNYFIKTEKLHLYISDAEDIAFKFYNYFNSNGDLTSNTVYVTPYRDIPESKYPEACPTISSVFDHWEPQENLINPTIENNKVSAIYELKTFTASYYNDNTIPELSGKLISSITVTYRQDAYIPPPQVDGYNNDIWVSNPNGRKPNERSIITKSELSNLTSDITCYTFFRKKHNVVVFTVSTDIQGQETTLSSFVVTDYEYQLSSSINTPDIQCYDFIGWNPPPSSYDQEEGMQPKNGWLIDCDDYRISAIYKRKSFMVKYYINDEGLDED